MVEQQKRIHLMRETVWSISGVSVRVLRGALASTRGLRAVSQWCIGYHSNGKRRVAMLIGITAESI